VIPRFILVCCALAASSASRAADAPPPAALLPGLLQATLGLAAVLVLIWAAAWLVRRLSPVGSSSRAPIKIVATQALGQRERVVLIEFGDHWLLLGVAPGQVSTLHAGPRSTLPQAAVIDAAPFAKLLSMARRHRES
jgi:flagellar protein FliO/FliZ